MRICFTVSGVRYECLGPHHFDEVQAQILRELLEGPSSATEEAAVLVFTKDQPRFLNCKEVPPENVRWMYDRDRIDLTFTDESHKITVGSCFASDLNDTTFKKLLAKRAKDGKHGVLCRLVDTSKPWFILDVSELHNIEIELAPRSILPPASVRSSFTP